MLARQLRRPQLAVSILGHGIRCKQVKKSGIKKSRGIEHGLHKEVEEMEHGLRKEVEEAKHGIANNLLVSYAYMGGAHVVGGVMRELKNFSRVCLHQPRPFALVRHGTHRRYLSGCEDIDHP